MAVKRMEASIDVVQAARVRIRNVFRNGLPVFMSFSGGKDSLCMAQIVVGMIQRGEINPDQLTVQFIDEEAIFPCIEAKVMEWRKKFLLLGAKFEWFCCEVRHYNCFNELNNDESFICWDSEKQDVWVRRPPAFAIRTHPLLKSRKDTYQDFLPRICAGGITITGIRTAESICLRRGQHISDKDVITNIELPCFVKPNLGGSSFGVTKVKTPAEIQPAIEKAFHESDEVMIEAFMKGTEVTCGCYKTKSKSVVLPITEVVTENEFFDYNAKYNGQVQEITPARISQDLTDRIQKITSLIYDIIGCSGIIRVDYIISDDGKINLLEVNTTPGMTETSFIPQQVKAAGLAMSEVITDIIEDKIS